jgi:ABC-type glutathione transport system ATPase component
MTLAIEGLSIRYRAPGGDVNALSDISLSVTKGRTLAVVGESGSGKSTVALAVMGLRRGTDRRRPHPVPGY